MLGLEGQPGRTWSRGCTVWWGGKDSNLGSRWQQIYSLPPLSTRVPPHRTPYSFQENVHAAEILATSDDSSDQRMTKISASAERTAPLTVRTRRRSGISGRDGCNKMF